MKVILAVWNKAGKGKTQSIQEFAKALLNKYPTHSIIYIKPQIIPSNPSADFRLIVEINKQIIGIESQGDPNTKLDRRLNELVNVYNCDILICSTRTSGSTVKAVENTSKNFGYGIIRTSTYEVSGKTNQATANKLKGEHILELLNSLKII